MKNKVPSYVINLKKAKDRKDYMTKILSCYDFILPEYVEAVDGNLLSDDELFKKFDDVLSYKRYGRDLNRGEIGCTFSHFKCYQHLLESGEEYALILEDDITILRSLEILPKLISILITDEPIVLLLSGDYWYYKSTKINETYKIVSVYDAVGSYAYLINKPAAKLLLTENIKISNVADNWSLYKRQGLRVKAIYPYLIDANIESFDSTINQLYFGECRENMPLDTKLQAFYMAFMKKIIFAFGGFVSKIRK